MLWPPTLFAPLGSDRHGLVATGLPWSSRRFIILPLPSLPWTIWKAPCRASLGNAASANRPLVYSPRPFLPPQSRAASRACFRPEFQAHFRRPWFALVPSVSVGVQYVWFVPLRSSNKSERHLSKHRLDETRYLHRFAIAIVTFNLPPQRHLSDSHNNLEVWGLVWPEPSLHYEHVRLGFREFQSSLWMNDYLICRWS